MTMQDMAKQTKDIREATPQGFLKRMGSPFLPLLLSLLLAALYIPTLTHALEYSESTVSIETAGGSDIRNEVFTDRSTTPPTGVTDPPPDNPNGEQQRCYGDNITGCLNMYFSYRNPTTHSLHSDCEPTMKEGKYHYMCTPRDGSIALPFNEVARTYFDLVSSFTLLVTSYYKNVVDNSTYAKEGLLYYASYYLIQAGPGCPQGDPTAQCIYAFIVNNITDPLQNGTSWADVETKSREYSDPVMEFLIRNPSYAEELK
ncbi:hypothetical protein BJ684DRAFT_16464 [Piptocephalis cylindrospora]|uniref:Uncharacterized protein n=1 Tax=Piptocephalis cylindrospora TaxID=1907219 RepID=A0A4P9Y2T3_9FUNG|nr:hypothetical protein BJ684DRAFT_16464 [Piptocephalis cylindrospora]|eukprot:RKP13103.1 hypothetical protein BJ684DRAFT_16464 [Piptocephalis cylindrospora]